MSVLAVNFLIWKAEKGWINLLPAYSTAYGYMTGRPFLLRGKRACVWIWSLSLCPRPMDQLSAYGAHLGLSKSEFTHQLEHHPASSLRSLRTLLIEEANHQNLIPAELRGLPLVNRRDSALRPVTNVLSEDIWTISHSIANQTTIPRVLFKHGKRSKEFIQSVSRASSSTDTNPYPVQIQHNRFSDSGSFSVSNHVPSFINSALTCCYYSNLAPVPITHKLSCFFLHHK